MRKVRLNKRKQLQLHFNNLFNKKSDYLKNLIKQNTEGIKEIENEKVDILIDKCLGLDKFERDYSFFNQPVSVALSPNREEKKTNKLKLFPDLKILIRSPMEKNDPQRYRQKDYIEDNFSNIYKNTINHKNNTEKYKKIIYGSYKPINRKKNSIDNVNKINYYNENEQKVSSSFLTGIGKSIINNNTFDKDNLDISGTRRKNYNQNSITII